MVTIVERHTLALALQGTVLSEKDSTDSNFLIAVRGKESRSTGRGCDGSDSPLSDSEVLYVFSHAIRTLLLSTLRGCG